MSNVTAVDVSGGRLAVHELGDTSASTTVIALHGITANALSFAGLARGLPPGTRLLAPDLRGRADSREIAGPWGMGAHADDVIAVADAYGLETFALIGHSMGAFVAAVAAARRPDRISRAVLIDGGIGFAVPEGTDIDSMLTAVIGPAMTRLTMTFGNRDAYLDFFSQNPAVGQVLSAGGQPAEDMRGYLFHDLVTREDGALASSCVLDAVRVDGGAVLTEPETLSAVRSLTVPTTMLWAPRGLMDQTPGLYTAEVLAAAGLPESVTTAQVPDCNHYSIIFSRQGVAAIIAALG